MNPRHFLPFLAFAAAVGATWVIAADAQKPAAKPAKPSSGKGAAPVVKAAAPAGPSFETYRLIGDRNIFNPNRVGRSSRSSDAPAPRTDVISFVGTMQYDKGLFAFFDSPDSKNVRYVKRVIAHGPASRVSKAAQAADGAATTETVHVAVAEGAVYVNNQKVQEDYPHADAPAEKNGREADVYLNPGEYFVMGDNRRDSRDSRTFGPIRSECVIGKAVLRFWPLSQFGLL